MTLWTRESASAIVLFVGSVELACAGCPLNVRDFGAKGDGVQNDTTPIQAAIDALPANPCGIVHIPSGKYLIRADSSGIRLRSNMTLEIAPGAILQAYDSATSYAVVRVDSLHDVTIVGGTIAGDRGRHTGAASDTCVGISIRGSRSVRVRDVRVRAMATSGILLRSYIPPSGATIPDSNVVIAGCVTDSNLVAGFDVMSAAGGSFVGCEASAGQAFGFRLRPGPGLGDVVSEWTVDGCRVTQDSFGIAVWGSGGCADPLSPGDAPVPRLAAPNANKPALVVVTRNIVRDALSRGIDLRYDASYALIEGNEVAQCRGAGIHVSCQGRHNTITGNLVVGNCQTAGIDSAQIVIRLGSDSNSVHANTCRKGTGLSAYGIQVLHSSCERNLVTNNDLLGSGSTRGFQNLGSNTRTAAGNSTAVQRLSAEVIGSGSRVVRVSWVTDPGPEGVLGYLLEKRASAPQWVPCTPLLRGVTSWTDSASAPGMRYRLAAFSEEAGRENLGEVAVSLPQALAAWPSPLRGGALSIAFTVSPGLDGRDPLVSVALFDVRGRRMRLLLRGHMRPGTHTTKWDARDDSGQQVASGVYVVHVQSSTGEVAAERVVIGKE